MARHSSRGAGHGNPKNLQRGGPRFAPHADGIRRSISCFSTASSSCAANRPRISTRSDRSAPSPPAMASCTMARPVSSRPVDGRRMDGFSRQLRPGHHALLGRQVRARADRPGWRATHAAPATSRITCSLSLGLVDTPGQANQRYFIIKPRETNFRSFAWAEHDSGCSPTATSRSTEHSPDAHRADGIASASAEHDPARVRPYAGAGHVGGGNADRTTA